MENARAKAQALQDEADELEAIVPELQAKIELAQVTGDKETVAQVAKQLNEAVNNKSSLREEAAKAAEVASTKERKLSRIERGESVNSVYGEQSPGQVIKPDDPLAIYRQQFNNADNKWHEAAKELLKSNRPEDIENVRLRKVALDEMFDNIDEAPLQTEHYFPTEREPSDIASRWAGEVRIRLAGIDKMIIERAVDPSMVTENAEFLAVVNRLREFLDEVEKSLNSDM
jgi:hypothetical protein